MRSLTPQVQRILALAMVCGTIGVSLALPFFDFSTIQTGREFPVHIYALYSWLSTGTRTPLPNTRLSRSPRH